ncbi:FecR family protein [Arcticibacter sp. MXS-1]|uniref:FecR family protein n=1 Tax=Arcticibacter sp. MXS-1 TaxID=3341726 RepID=UPI0035A98673
MTLRKKESMLRNLARKWKDGTISEEEKEIFNKWYDSFDDSFLEVSTPGAPQEISERIYRNIVAREKIRKTSFLSFRGYLPVKIAASVLFILSLTFFFYYISQPLQQQHTQTEKMADGIRPGENKAVLTLPNGARVVLDSAKNRLLASRGNLTVRQSQAGQIVFQLNGTGVRRTGARAEYNTISTPRGGQYQIELPDGTRVWLNAASSLKFPTVFGTDERRVELTGEAYFEVTKLWRVGRDSKRVPFIVATQGQEVRVLGTHFNVNAYPDEGVIRTTLLEGAVKVFKAGTGESRLLRPGQQLTNGNTLVVGDVDAEQEIAWQKGYFIFNNEPCESVMRKISRWYDVDVEYRGDIRNKRFGGAISKFERISEVLRIMELTGTIHFKIEERRIIVMP